MHSTIKSVGWSKEVCDPNWWKGLKRESVVIRWMKRMRCR